jgi:hypothetical protein
MKTKSLAVALIMLAILASDALAVMRSPYPRKTSPPDTIIIITDDHKVIGSTHRPSK